MKSTKSQRDYMLKEGASWYTKDARDVAADLDDAVAHLDDCLGFINSIPYGAVNYDRRENLRSRIEAFLREPTPEVKHDE